MTLALALSKACRTPQDVAGRSDVLSEWPLSLRVFGRLQLTGVRGRTEAGVGKAWKEETAGEFAPTLVSIYGEFAGAG